MTYLTKLEPLIWIDRQLDLVGSALRQFIQDSTSNFATESGEVSIHIGTSLHGETDFDYQIIIGERSFTVEWLNEALVFYLNHIEIEENLIEILDLIKEKLFSRLKCKFIERCEKSLKHLKHNSDDISDEESDNLNRIRTELMTVKDLDELASRINQLEFMSSCNLQLIEIRDFHTVTKDDNLFFLGGESDLGFFWAFKLPKTTTLGSFHMTVINIFKNHLEIYNRQELKVNEMDIWDLAVENLPVGLVVLDDKDNIRTYNQNFMELSVPINRLKQFSDRDFIKLGDDTFQVSLRPLDIGGGDFRVYLFQTIEDQIDIGSANEELGIICSSLAHELNNPLAGILASLTVIELDDEDGNLSGQLKEMKKGIGRCKQLVETFLGFSKTQGMPGATLNNLGVKAGFDQAMELMRFRMIEANINMNLDYIQNGELKHETNFSVLVMIGYLFFGELTTSLSHHNLLTQTNTKVIDLNIVEREQELTFSWTPDFPLSTQFMSSLLFIHLLESQKFQVQYSNTNLKLSVIRDDLVENENLQTS